MKQIGKIGMANIKANKRIDQYFQDNDITVCEIRFPGCQWNYLLTRCHKEKRENYRGDLEMLGDPSQVILACVHCHSILDDRSKTTKEQSDAIFKRQRP